AAVLDENCNRTIIFVRNRNRTSACNAPVHGDENQSRSISKRDLAASRWHYRCARRGPCCSGIPTCNATRLVGRTVVVALNADVVSSIDHLVQSADVIAMLVAADHVIEPVGRLNSDGQKIGYDPALPHTRVSRLQQHGCAVRPFHEDRVSPADIDVVDLQVLTERDSSRKQKRYDDPEHESHPANTHIYLPPVICVAEDPANRTNLTGRLIVSDYVALTRLLNAFGPNNCISRL